MKKLVLILFVFVSVSAFAQVKESAGNTAKNKKLFVVNGVIFEKDIATIPKDSIVFVDSLLKDANKDFPMQHDVIILVTKDFATKEYRKKLGLFSKKYKKHIQEYTKYNADDGITTYSINDRFLVNKDEIIRELYKLSVKNIRKVLLYRKETCCGTNISVNILTKN